MGAKRDGGLTVRAKSGTIPITLKTDVSPLPPLPFVTDSHVQAMVSGVLSAAPVPVIAPVFADDGAGIALYEADALALLPRFAPESFDAVFADPPYFLSGGGMTCQSGKRVSVNKGAWDEPTTLQAMHEFNRAWLAACFRLLKPNGTIFVTGTHHNIHSVGFALLERGYKILNDLAWHKGQIRRRICRAGILPMRRETVLWARKDTPDARHYFDYAAMKADNGGKQMQSLWHIKPPAPREKRYGKHPTQKPEALLDRIIRAATRPGDAVLDPFCGSGTTGVVCARLGRGFVGVEREAEYLEKAVLRIRDELCPARLVKVINRVRERKARYKTKPTVIIDQ